MPIIHFAPIALGTGSIVLPGNWGRLLNRYRSQPTYGDAYVLMREMVLEQVRLLQFPAKPSRLNACFTCPDASHAKLYRDEHDAFSHGMPHLVEFVDPTQPEHRGPLEALGCHDLKNSSAPIWPTLTERAVKYWSEDWNGPREIVTASALRVLGQTTI